MDFALLRMDCGLFNSVSDHVQKTHDDQNYQSYRYDASCQCFKLGVEIIS